MDKTVVKKYNRIKLLVSLTGIGINLLFWTLVIVFGLTGSIASHVEGMSASLLIQFYFFAIALGIISLVVNLPLTFYSGYIVEHRFALSNQNIFQWFFEHLKGLLVGLVLGGIILTILYLLLWKYPQRWWLGVWLFILLFSIILSRLAPVLIFPLFYKFTALENPELKEKISRLGRKWKLNITGIFQFNLSKTTKKANAAFTGLGKSKRVILGDTLLNNFNEDEIEAVFAHEVGHYVHHHLLKLLIQICSNR